MAFVRNTTLGIFVFNLSEQLDNKPVIKYYKNGKPCGESYPFPLSHKDNLPALYSDSFVP